MNLQELLQISGGYWATCALHAAVKLDVFTMLAGNPSAATEIARSISCDQRGLGMLLNALVSMELLEKEGDIFKATTFSDTWLSSKSGSYMGHIIMHHHNLVDGWSRLDEAVRKGTSVRRRISHEADEMERENFLMGMFNLASILAPKVAAELDLKGRTKLLDLGGGPGTYAIHFCIQNPEMTAVVFDLETTRPFAEKTIAGFGLSDRITFESGDVNEDEPGNGYDAVWISHLLHSESPERGAVIVEKAARALKKGGLLMVQEFILDNSKAGPMFPALFSLNMLIGTNGGQAYSEKELTGMMSGAGLSNITRLHIELPNGAGIISGIAG